MPLVSVIVTTFNREKLLLETLHAILNQTFTDFELIVVDNYSNYDFIKSMETIGDHRIRAFQNHNNGVIALNRNYGIKIAKGEYLAFCDDDDIWNRDKLEEQINYILNHNLKNKRFVIYSNCIEFFEKKENITRKKKIKNINSFLLSNQVSFSTSFVSNNFGKLKLNETPELFAVEDYVFWMELSLSGFTFHLIEKPLIRYRVLSNSSSADLNGISHLRRIIAIMHIAIKYKKPLIKRRKLSYSVLINIIKFFIKSVMK